jgi:hypothetical protein
MLKYKQKYLNTLEFKKELTKIINKYNIDNELNVADFILAENIMLHLKAMETLQIQTKLQQALENGDFYDTLETPLNYE